MKEKLKKIKEWEVRNYIENKGRKAREEEGLQNSEVNEAGKEKMESKEGNGKEWKLNLVKKKRIGRKRFLKEEKSGKCRNYGEIK